MTPWNATPDFPVFHYLPEIAQIYVHGVSELSNHLTLFCLLLLLPSTLPSIRVFSNESALHIRWPEYWSFSFSISPSDEYSGLTSFRMEWPCSLKNSTSRMEQKRSQRKTPSLWRLWHPSLLIRVTQSPNGDTA